jgi:hypothetical protein
MDPKYCNPDTWYSKAEESDKTLFRDWIKNLLATNTVDLTFLKKDGTVRNMKCTLKESVLPQFKKTEGKRKEKEEVLTVFDLQIKEWRACRFENIKEIKFTLGE